jgi:hypothetical protein
MDQAVESNTGHYVDEKTRDLVETVEDHGIPPHGDGDGIIPKGETECADEESL